jgi:plasmid maintenance system antidote protein VapI
MWQRHLWVLGSYGSESHSDFAFTHAAKSAGIEFLVWTTSISADMAIRLSEALGTSPDLWAGMQSQYDLWQATKKRRKKVGRRVVAG